MKFSPSAEKRYARMRASAEAAIPRHAELQMFRIGDRVLVGLPGEPISEVGTDTQNRLRGAGATEAVVLGLANDYIGYILNAKEYAHGGYEVDSRSYFGPGLGDFIADETHKAAVPWLTAANDARGPTEEAVVLFDGKSLDNWVIEPPDANNATRTCWSVKDGVIHCEGKPSGYIRTSTVHENYRLTLEWRWPGGKGGNSGLLLHVHEPDTVWPKSIESQLQHQNEGDFWVIGGTDFKEHVNKDHRRTVRHTKAESKPIGQWNRMVAVCKSNTIKIYVNGTLVNTATDTTVTRGYIAVQSEGTPIQFRNIFLEPL